MSKKRQKHSKRWLTRGFFIYSTLIILVISVATFGIWLLMRTPVPSNVVEDAAWLEENIWRVESYKQKWNGKYDIHLLRIEPALNPSFDELQLTFRDTEYSAFNSYYLAEGVNCQGMTVYLADWCERFAYEYSVAWTAMHTYIFIKYDGAWYKFDFDVGESSVEEVAAKYVQKGMVTE